MYKYFNFNDFNFNDNGNKATMTFTIHVTHDSYNNSHMNSRK